MLITVRSDAWPQNFLDGRHREEIRSLQTETNRVPLPSYYQFMHRCPNFAVGGLRCSAALASKCSETIDDMLQTTYSQTFATDYDFFFCSPTNGS